MLNARNNKILTDDEIVELIINYIDENLYSYAVMIDGEWGCGKTWFIKKCLYEKLVVHEEKKNKQDSKYKERRIIYVSLYGIKSVEEISKQLLMEVYLAKMGKAKGLIKKSTEVAGGMLPAIFDMIKPFTGLELESDNMTKAVGGFLSVKNSVLIFDDLERCNCPINEILGYINGFVEHEGMKVILVANQKEIRKSTYLRNQELKYLVAVNENIVFEEASEEEKTRTHLFSDRKIEEKAKEPVNINTIESRIDKLFGQDILYEKVREKLIGETVYYYPALMSIFMKLIKNDNIDEKLQKYLLERISFFENHMNKVGHLNIRTFQFYLSKVRTLYGLISKMNSEGLEAFINYVIEYTFKVCVSYKSGTFDYDWDGCGEYTFKNPVRNNIFDNCLSFRFVDDYILKSILEEDRVKEMLIVYEDEYVKESNKEFAVFRNLESNWFLSKDEEVEKKIKEIIQAIEEDKYEVKTYARIISLLIDLEQYGFLKNNMKVVISKIKSNIRKLNNHIYLDSGYCSGCDEEKKEKYRIIMEELQDEIEQHFQKQVSENIEQYISEGEGWAGNLERFVERNMREIKNQNGFLSQMDINRLAKKIENSASYDIHAFRGCVLDLYVKNSLGVALKKEGEKIDELLTKIEDLDAKQFDRIKQMQVNYLISNLKKAKEYYNNEIG